MDLFRADLHLHSRFSRATSKGLTPRHLAAWARVKGISLLGTGDFTHPGWLNELAEQLVPDDDSGLFKLAKEGGLTREIPWLGDVLPQGRVRFMLQAEISSIYSQGGKVRKIHNLVYVPTLEAARRLNERLEKVGNLASDGRPILGLPAKDLLSMVLDLGPGAFLVPAHVWTPWFSLFGSKSGFDAIEECFGDNASEIFALETGLSSDPDMNRLWSALDRFRLISNSDAHSGEKLGREANVFSGALSYDTVVRALKGEGLGQKFLGTVEFFPEEGKYHLDGHRKCGVVLDPQESKARGDLCPVCGKPLTVGVLHRVMDLCDREEPVQPTGQPGFVSLVPLSELIGEVLGCGPATKAARALYLKCLSRLGPEMTILQESTLSDIALLNPYLAEAVKRMRQGRVLREPGFDGQYGRITVFSPAEAREMKGGRLMVGLAEPAARTAAGPRAQVAPAKAAPAAPEPEVVYNPAQQEAIEAGPGPVLVVAGPGTGKTQTLMGRISALVRQGVSPRHILALTFTRRAADELRERLTATLGEDQGLPRADTLHALAFEYWAAAYNEAPVIMTEEAAIKVFAEANPELPAARLKAAWQTVSLARERREALDDEPAALALAYAKQRASWNLADYTDLLEFWLEQINDKIYISPYTHVLVDEVQDLTPLQLAVIKALAGPEGRWLFAIGDPDQSIYSFRGAAPDVAANLMEHWPDLRVIRLAENYRSAQQILDLAASAIPGATGLAAKRPEAGTIQVFTAPSSASEASWVGERIKRLLGPTSLSLMADEAGGLSPGEIAVLVRVKALIPLLERTLDRLGVPVAVPEAEAFWLEPRVAALLRTASRFLGMSLDDADVLDVPEKVLVKGPLSLSAYLGDIPPFDRMFWTSREFKAFARAFDEQSGWVGLVNWINLQSELEQVSRRAEKVQIMSLHAAKGLEFTAVFLPALEDGILPFAGAGFLTGKPGGGEIVDADEERRLFYVGLTRAKRLLYLSRAQRREIYGREHRLPASRFLENLPGESLERSALVAKVQRQEEQLKLI